MDATRIVAHPANAAVARLVGEGRLARRGEPYAIDGYELGAHPDLEERLTRLAGAVGVGVAGFRGHPVVVDEHGVVRALATGTSGLLLRLGDGPERDAVMAHGGAPMPELGEDWVRADAWLSDVPRPGGTALLESWLAAACR